MAGKHGRTWLRKKRNKSVRLALGAGILAAAAVSLAVFVPRRRWQAMTSRSRAWQRRRWPLPDRLGRQSVGRVTAPTPPVFDDLRPFDEF